MMTRRLCTAVLAIMLCLWMGAWVATARDRWTPDQANAWHARQRWLVGCNYIPSSAINQLEMWQADTFDPKAIDRELGWAADLGFTSVRVFLHDLVWKNDPEGFFRRVDRFLEIADGHQMGVMMVIFDGVWDPDPIIGPQPAPTPGVHNSGWVQSPGREILADESKQQALESYVKAVIRRYANDRRIQVWDLFNEPDNPNSNSYGPKELSNKDEVAARLVTRSFAWAREVDPSQPLTVGLWRGPAWNELNKLNQTHQVALQLSDVISFHDYGDPDTLGRRIDELKTYDRPLLCTEFMARGVGSTFTGCLSIMKSRGVGAYCWGLVDGKSQTKYPWSTWQQTIEGDPYPWHHDIFRLDGVPYSDVEVNAIRSQTGASATTMPARLTAVPFTDTRLLDQFWAPRLETNRTVTVWYDFKKCEETGRIDNFSVAGKLKQGQFRGIRFDDSDVFKVIEGASYSLAVQDDPKLDAYLDALIVKIVAAQEPDGYLYTSRTIDPNNLPQGTGATRWSHLVHSHELYNVGHLYEAAVAHYLATGKKSLLDVAIKNADLVCKVFGPADNQLQDVPGHQEIELALVKLYEVTKDDKYLEQAEFFIDRRGKTRNRKTTGEYSQDHSPVAEQTEPVGHAVRAMYLYAAMADVAARKGRDDYIAALDRVWSKLLERKIYLTGGIGAEAGHEGFGPDYELPNATAYNETCAAIGLVLWAHRMFLLEGDAQFMDTAELALYNGLLSGVSTSGDRFFYPNPLESFGGVERQAWFGTSCCPVNIVRLLPSVPGFIYATSDDAVYVNLFIASETQLSAGGTSVVVKQRTSYPLSGHVDIDVVPDVAAEFALKVRIPVWVRRDRPLASDLYRYALPRQDSHVVRVNGEVVDAELDRGYATITRTWHPGDTVSLDLPMEVRRVEARPEVVADRGRFAVQRGPLVYCAESADNDGDMMAKRMPPPIEFDVQTDSRKLGGFATIRLAASNGDSLALIPYYAWANRGAGEMRVWFPTDKEAIRERRVGTPTDQDQAYDYVIIGRGDSERAHSLKGERTNSGPAGPIASWRDANSGGWFSYDLALPVAGPAEVVITYWGSDEGDRVFDVVVDGRVVGSEDLSAEKPGEFFTRRYPLPKEVTKEPGKVTVRLQAKPRKMAGGIFGLYVTPASKEEPKGE